LNDPNGPYRLAETYNNANTNGVVTYSFPKPFPATVTSSLTGTQNVTALPMKTDEGVIRQYNATLEGAVKGVDLRASYIGSRGVRMNYTLNMNKPRASATPFATSRLPYPQFASAYVTRADGQWRYDSAQFEARKRVGNFTFDSSITWANNRSNYANLFDPYNVTVHWTRDGSDRRLYGVASAVWALPLGKGKRLFSNAGRFANLAASNWTLQAIATAASGQYYSPLFTGPDPANASPGYVTALADCIGDANSGARTITKWFNPAAFAAPPASAGRYGTCGMNSLEGYPIHVAHMSLAKRVPINEWLTATLTVQVSNVTNTPHFTIPNNNVSNPGAGAFTASSMVPNYYPERQGSRQLDVKIRFHW
jgi:hypothetical protein